MIICILYLMFTGVKGCFRPPASEEVWVASPATEITREGGNVYSASVPRQQSLLAMVTPSRARCRLPFLRL